MERITTPFGFTSTAADVIAGIDLAGKRIIVTGGASGIGIETARAFASAGAEVTLAVRNVEAGADAARDIAGSTGNDRIHVAELDLSDLDSVAAFAAEWRGPLNALVNNAGVMLSLETRTPHGSEMHFATNHLGHFALALHLYNALAAGAPARIVSLSSSGHLFSPVVFDDLDFRFRPFDGLLGYAQSKTANILFAVGATELWREHGITANAVMPGAIETNLQRHVGGIRTPPEFRKTPKQGAATSVLLAASPLLDGIGSRYFLDCNEAEVVHERTAGLTGVASYALDHDNALRLWALSLELVGSRAPAIFRR